MDSGLTSKLEDIKGRIQNLILLHQKLKDENLKLINANTLLSSTLEEEKIKLKELQEKNKIIKLAKSISEVENTGDVKTKINELIREIDKCISFLNA